MLKVGQYERSCGEGKLKIFPCFQIKGENKALKETYEDFFIEKF